MLLMSAAGASVFASRVCALEPAAKLANVWPEVQAGTFDMAAERLQLHVTEWPLDRNARSSLAILQFAAGMFDKASDNLGRVVKLERGYDSQIDPLIDIDYLETWFRLSRLRAGRVIDAPPRVSPYSLLVLLDGELEIGAFVSQRTDDYFAYLDRMEDIVSRSETTTTEQGASVTVTMSVTRPPRDAVERDYLCVGNFMLGEQALGLGRREEGRSLLGDAVAAKAETMVEHFIAKTELTRF